MNAWDQDCDQLLQGSPELIDTNFFTADWHMVLLSSSGNMLVPEDRKGIVGTSDIAEGMTYEQLQVSLLSNKELFSKRRELIILIKGFRTPELVFSSEDKLPVFQLMLLILKRKVLLVKHQPEGIPVLNVFKKPHDFSGLYL